MFTRRWQLFRLVGIPIYVDATWFIILALITFSLAMPEGFPWMLHHYFPRAPIAVPTYEYWLMGLIAAIAFFACILLHELGHAVVARAKGMPMRGITLFLFGGVADIGDEPPSAGTEFVVAIAGPLVSLFLAAVLAGVTYLGYEGSWPDTIILVLGYLAFINALVLAFNLIPAFPLDGGRVFRSIIWGITGNQRSSTHFASVVGQGFAWFLIAVGIFLFFTGNFLPGVWLGLIGMFLNNAARSTYQQVLVREALTGEPVRRFMNPNPITVDPSLDVAHWVEDFVYRYHRKTFPVVADDRLEGYIDTRAISKLPRSDWGRHTVAEVMRHDLGKVSIGPDADALDALRKMQQAGVSRLLVTERDRLVGIIGLRDLLQFLNLKLELESQGETEQTASEEAHRRANGHARHHVGPM